MPNTVPASATALPSAKIIRFPIQQATGRFDLTENDWSGLYITLTIADEFTGMDDAEIEITLREMLATSHSDAISAIYHMVRKNGEVLETLRKALGFLAVMDRRLMAAANRVLEQKAKR